MRSLDTSTGSRFSALVVAIAALLVVTDRLGPVGAVGVIAVAVGVGWRFFPNFGRTVVVGLFAGAVAGLLILGPGARMAMRLVAIVDPLRMPELTLEGTAVVIVMVGGALGAVFGLIGNVLRVGWPLHAQGSAVAVTIVLMATLLVEAELRAEFMTLGRGPWMNIPLFTAVAFAYGRVAAAIMERATARFARSIATHRVDVRA